MEPSCTVATKFGIGAQKRILAGMLLDAQVRLGELLSKLARQKNQYGGYSGVTGKLQAIQDLKLADNANQAKQVDRSQKMGTVK
jgi:hypothetical protein